MLRICAWHRQSFGYFKIMGVALGPWQRTHGMCEACSDLHRAQVYGKSPRMGASWRKEVTRVAVALTALVAWCLLALLVAGCGPSQSDVEGQVRAVLHETRFAQVEVSARQPIPSSAAWVVYLHGRVATEEDKFDAQWLAWERLKPGLFKGLINNIASDQFRDAQVERFVERRRAQ